MVTKSLIPGAGSRTPTQRAMWGALIDSVFALRQATEALCAPLTVEDQQIQSMSDVSPTKWHLAHATWFWETFVLEPHCPGYQTFNPDFRFLFNSYYDAVGDRPPRAERGLLSRPSLDEVAAYRRHVDDALGCFSDYQPEGFAAASALIELGLAHEEQHQELILTDIKHVLSKNPLAPVAYPSVAQLAPRPAPHDLRWVEFSGGEVEIGAGEGAAGESFAFDNERPRHRVLLEPYALASRPVTNGEYLAFVEDGGYEDSRLWLSDGWAERCALGATAPLYWRRRDGAWLEFTLHGLEALHRDAPVAHLSYYEAWAYAEWVGARLPDEREWETAARGLDPCVGRFALAGRSAHPWAASASDGLTQMFGDVWEWTRSAYAAYPRYHPTAAAIGEYNGKFMCSQHVLKGGSCATARGHVRATYRNFFPPNARWQFSGVRLARDL